VARVPARDPARPSTGEAIRSPAAAALEEVVGQSGGAMRAPCVGVVETDTSTPLVLRDITSTARSCACARATARAGSRLSCCTTTPLVAPCQRVARVTSAETRGPASTRDFPPGAGAAVSWCQEGPLPVRAVRRSGKMNTQKSAPAPGGTSRKRTLVSTGKSAMIPDTSGARLQTAAKRGPCGSARRHQVRRASVRGCRRLGERRAPFRSKQRQASDGTHR
jgi:hypothetical protein